MGTRKKFTPEELKHLRANPYTLRVTPDSISYTLAFKEAFWALSLQGYTGTAAFRKLGYKTLDALCKLLPAKKLKERVRMMYKEYK